MSLKSAINEFGTRYYRWSLEDFKLEVAERFPSISAIKDSIAINFVSYMHSLLKDRKIQLLEALVKKSHSEAIKLIGEHMTAEEKKKISSWINYSTYSPYWADGRRFEKQMID